MRTDQRTLVTIILSSFVLLVLIVSSVITYFDAALFDNEQQEILSETIHKQTYEGSFYSVEGIKLTSAEEPFTPGNAIESAEESFAWLIGGLRENMSDYLYDGSDTNKYGDDIYLSIDSTLQNYCYNNILNGNEGSVVILENKTGRILTLASHSDSNLPAYNLNHPEDFMNVCEDVDGSLYIRGIFETDAPGSTFKIITGAAALQLLEEKKLTSADFDYFDDGYFITPDEAHTITNYAYREYGQIDLESLSYAYSVSCNTYFANLALKVGWKNLYETASSFLIGEDIDIPFLATIHSEINNPEYSLAVTAMTGIGQGNLSITPLHLALIGSTVANNGTAYQPTVVDKIFNSSGKTEYIQDKTKIIKKVISKKTAKKLKDALHECALSDHYGFDESIYGVVYAKTGTAETPSGTHTYIVCFTDTYSFCISYNRGEESSDLIQMAKQLVIMCNQITGDK